MAFSESESVAYGHGGISKTGSPIQSQESPHEEITQPDQSSSIFSLTLDQIQLKSGKSFGSMSMDEFLATLWNDEENQQVPWRLDQIGPINGDKDVGSQPSLAQGSFTIPTPLCKKTVDGVWSEIERDLPQQRKPNNIVQHEPPQRQQTFRGMTLNDFFVKAGICLESPGSSQQNKAAAPIHINGASLDANYGMGHAFGSTQQNKAAAPIQTNSASLGANYGMGHAFGSTQPNKVAAPIQINSASLGANYGMEHAIGSSQQNNATAPIRINGVSLDANYGMGHVIGSSQQNMLAPIQNNNASMNAKFGMGHVIGSSQQNMLAPIQNNNASMDANFGMGHVMGIGFPGQQIVGNNLASGNGYAAASGYPIFTQSKTIMGDSSNGSRIGNVTNSLLEPGVAQNKKRIIDGPPEVVVERRQRRMIKNRESAARSRARKQAYTVELEFELNQFKQENAKLKQLVEEYEQRQKEKVPRRKRSKSARKKLDKTKKTVRRTVSLGW